MYYYGFAELVSHPNKYTLQLLVMLSLNDTELTTGAYRIVEEKFPCPLSESLFTDIQELGEDGPAMLPATTGIPSHIPDHARS